MCRLLFLCRARDLHLDVFLGLGDLLWCFCSFPGLLHADGWFSALLVVRQLVLQTGATLLLMIKFSISVFSSPYKNFGQSEEKDIAWKKCRGWRSIETPEGGSIRVLFMSPWWRW
ncbi:uncharacterized protein [Triticum aestivum]|uniref:uncharacterized protein n=1 Tax=Triticum aestivum TaxID=4565 RepID=UPI001D02394D|nr:uncharacterized protein LOC123190714 [Triticum aestivum]